ncbi:hypothetical protein BJ912DRAFT_1056765 [Pholiota molesta]|nr:hypothetical protein BJ912DRAFT_1056765 [Pholiota molesta]
MAPNLSYIAGDLFLAPPNSILVHACNTQGSWGAGIALAFKLGTCLLIPGDVHDIACLFTSRAYGKRKDTPEEILAATQGAVQDLLKQNVQGKALHACRFNSGKFAVPWEDTEAILKALNVSMTIYTPAEP